MTKHRQRDKQRVSQTEIERKSKQEEEEEEEEEDEEEEVPSKGKKGSKQDLMNQLNQSELSAIKDSTVRKFNVPKINFKAKTYPELFDWRTTAITEPPFTASLSDDQIKDLVITPLTPPAFTCHTQAVERGI